MDSQRFKLTVQNDNWEVQMFVWTSTKPDWSLKQAANQFALGTVAVVLPRQVVSAKEDKFLGRELMPVLVSLKSFIQNWITAGPHQSADG